MEEGAPERAENETHRDKCAERTTTRGEPAGRTRDEESGVKRREGKDEASSAHNAPETADPPHEAEHAWSILSAIHNPGLPWSRGRGNRRLPMPVATGHPSEELDAPLLVPPARQLRAQGLQPCGGPACQAAASPNNMYLSRSVAEGFPQAPSFLCYCFVARERVGRSRPTRRNI